MKNKNKNIAIIIIIILIILLFIVLINRITNKSQFYELTYSEVMEKINNKDSFVLCITSTICSHCEAYKPKLKKISSRYNVDIYYIDINLASKEEQKEFSSLLSFDGTTPTTLFLINGEETTTSNRLIGEVSIDKVVTKLKSNGFIK